MSGHYFSAEPDVPERRGTVEATIWGRAFTFTTATGTFSHTGLDPATAVLFRSVEPPTGGGRFLDLGCGWGPIAVALAAACPQARVDAVDVNRRALRLCAENAATAGVGDRVTPVAAEQADPDARYDQLWSNPPIRIGKEALHALLLDWLPRLAPGGVARLVVGRNLGADPLQTWLTGQGYPCERTASAKGFRVLTARRG
ncbi:16S rRNA G1207 methylase RsmC [Friedmanniella endophytica]|uniref:16S rRNA G1207 methylase RsmC n=1 Tax=Microlunatus kandeliicorticis TaxID=1759536 RepID=A0A7W3IQ38_9ACTN|nr:methyltransferase [Microlunatus kandeliicorticis]MBA8793149.1 16S rRNA G1207 methylase RsmC [Microlunatus kandeliicorticis]